MMNIVLDTNFNWFA